MPIEPAPRPTVVPGIVAGPGVQVIGLRGDEATSLRSSSTIVGLHFATVVAGETAFAGSVPITGKLQLEGLFWVIGTISAAGTLHELQLAVATNVPTAQEDVDAGDQLFAHASTKLGEASTLFLLGGGVYTWIPLSTVVVMNGRRFVGRVKNTHGSISADAYAGILVHRVLGGSGSADPRFLTGEELVER